MALHPSFPRSPYEVLDPEQRWFPAAEELRSTAYEKLLPPLIAKIRAEVTAWRARGNAGASPRSIALLKWWFETESSQEPFEVGRDRHPSDGCGALDAQEFVR
jgi:type III restriction enzyme